MIRSAPQTQQQKKGSTSMTPGIRAIARIATAGLLLAAFAGSSSAVAASKAIPHGSAAGSWTGSAQVHAQEVPFRLVVSGSGDQVKGALINGGERSVSSSGSYSDGHLILHFDYYANTLDATIDGDQLSGTFGRPSHSVPIRAELNGKALVPAPNPPHVGGVWEVAVDKGTKGEDTWKLRVRQNGAHVDAVIERIDGDTGNLYGVWHDGVFAVSHFTAAGPSFAVLRPLADGTLQLETAAHGGGVQAFAAHRVSPVRPVAAGVDDPLHHTFLKSGAERLTFRFPDLNGKLVSNRDAAFAHKVLIVSIGGSWCPNCQDEAPFLESLYRTYHSRGLEIVELSFEEASQLQDPVRLRAVIHRYGLTYPVLLAGTPDQLDEKFPYVSNLNCWPTTFFVGRDGRVKAVHTGYEGPATGSDNRSTEKEMTSMVEGLLAGKDPAGGTARVQMARGE